jgi:phage N-6-adenine-methyltransferase
MNEKRGYMLPSKGDEWETPWPLFKVLMDEFKIDCDAAATYDNTCMRSGYIGKEHNQGKGALGPHPWTHFGSRFFLNPPHSQIDIFIRRAYVESQLGAVVVCLIPARTETRWWHDCVMKADEIRFIRGRIRFRLQGKPAKNTSTFPSCVVVFPMIRPGICRRSESPLHAKIPSRGPP